MPIYDKPTKALMREFAEAQLTPGRTFEKREPVEWFKRNYPKIARGTVEMHVESMSVNAPFRRHHPNVRPGSGHDLFFKLGPGRFRLWDSAKDPAPRYAGDFPDGSRAFDDGLEEPRDAEENNGEANGDASASFAFERDLRNYLEKNLSALEPGLRVYEDEGLTGIEFPAGGRRIDILAAGADGALVVVELKVSRGYDRVVGQLLRYMAWVKANLADGRTVRGIIVASEISDDLKLAASLIPDVKLVEYELSFKLRPVT